MGGVGIGAVGFAMEVPDALNRFAALAEIMTETKSSRVAPITDLSRTEASLPLMLPAARTTKNQDACRFARRGGRLLKIGGCH